METFKLVLPSHLNHYGYLFGGNMLKWVDEYSWIAVSFDYPKCRFVTIGLDTVEFKHSVQQGSILRFEVSRVRKGITSVTYHVDVSKRETGETTESLVFSTNVTFVSVDEHGDKAVIVSSA